jgi:hypothetical protein
VRRPRADAGQLDELCDRCDRIGARIERQPAARHLRRDGDQASRSRLDDAE